MIPYSEKLFKDLEDQLKFISLEQVDVLKRAELSIGVCEKSLSHLKNFIKGRKFKTPAEEVLFFKKIKPRFASKLNYYVLLFNLEKGRPLTSIKAQVQYLEKEQLALDAFMEKNLEFYTYYRTESASLDDKYFIRDKIDIHLVIDECFFNLDRSFNTTHDGKISRIIANDMLAVYIRNEIIALEKAQLMAATGSSSLRAKQLNWTESKIALIELIYAIHSANCINSGNVELSEIASIFETAFNIELNDYYRKYIEIKSRKGQHTKFLDQLKQVLVNRINIEIQ